MQVHPKRLQLRVEGATVLEGSLVDCGEITVDGESFQHLSGCA